MLTGRIVAVEVIPGPTHEEWQRWEDRRQRAVRRALPAAERRRRLLGVRGPCDLLGDPLDPSPAGRQKAERAHYLATGYPPVHPDLLDLPEDADLAQLDDELWAELHAPWRRRALSPSRAS